MRSRLASIFMAIGLFVACAATSFGQATGGAVTGDVLDATGAVVPNATITLRSKQTGQTLNGQTTGTGSYNFPNVPVGEYTITIESAGFAPATQELKVTLNQTTSVNATLQAAGLAGVTVDVTAASEALVQSDSSQLGKSFEVRQIIDLPTFGNQNNLALLAPNVVNFNAFSGTSGTGGAVGGVRARYNSFNIDGVDNNNFSPSPARSLRHPRAIQEFTLLSNNFNASSGRLREDSSTPSPRRDERVARRGLRLRENQKFNAAASTAQEAAIQSRLRRKGRVTRPHPTTAALRQYALRSDRRRPLRQKQTLLFRRLPARDKRQVGDGLDLSFAHARWAQPARHHPRREPSGLRHHPRQPRARSRADDDADRRGPRDTLRHGQPHVAELLQRFPGANQYRPPPRDERPVPLPLQRRPLPHGERQRPRQRTIQRAERLRFAPLLRHVGADAEPQPRQRPPALVPPRHLGHALEGRGLQHVPEPHRECFQHANRPELEPAAVELQQQLSGLRLDQLRARPAQLQVRRRVPQPHRDEPVPPARARRLPLRDLRPAADGCRPDDLHPRRRDRGLHLQPAEVLRLRAG